MIKWDTCLNYLFEEQVNKTPNHIAASIYEEVLTYRELNERANQYAHYMRSIGVGADSIVGILMERSIELVVAMVGILKAGGAYLPIDPVYPQQRIDFILEDADVSAVLTSKKYRSQLLECNATVFCMDADQNFIAGQSVENPIHINQSCDLAYVIYTSGSSGVPKGCMIEHRSICNRILWMQKEYKLTEEDRVLQKTPYTFDVSVWEFFWPIITGAQIVFAKPGGHKDSNYLIELISAGNITVCHFVPSMLKFFLSNKKVHSCSSLRYVFTSGEALSYELMLLFMKKLGAQLHNLYGPTEAAVDVTYWACEERSDGIVPIGRAIDNTVMYVLDENLKEVKRGQEAELYIGGIGLARGYLNRKELTDKSFIKNPYTGERIYKTGDIGRFLKDGTIEYKGRADSQIKLRGNRIELGEIETVLKMHSAIDDAVVCVKENTGGDPKLVAYVVVHLTMPQSKELRDFLKAKLPEYMLPNFFAAIDKIPVTSHGKLDRKALPWPIQNVNKDMRKNQELKEADCISQEEIKAFVLSTVKGLLINENITSDMDLFDIGATSLTMVRIVEEIDQEYHIAVPIDLFLEEPTIDSLVGYLVSHIIKAQPDKTIMEEEYVNVTSEGMKTDQDMEGNLLLNFVRGIIGAPQLSEQDDLFDYGATSFTLVQITEFIEQNYKIPIPIDLILSDPSVESIKAYIRSNSDEMQNNQTELLESSAVSFEEFSRLCSLLRETEINGEKKYLYPSAGGLYSIQTYLYIKEKQVDGLKEGYYYYHPVKNGLYFIEKGSKISENIFDKNYKDVYEKAGFLIFFVANLDAIEPVYAQISPSLTVLDAGYMTQLLLSHQEEIKLELCPVIGVNFSLIRNQLSLGTRHQFIHCLLGGKFGKKNSYHLFGKIYDSKNFPRVSDYLKIDETTILKKMKFMNKEEHDSFVGKQLHLRTCGDEEYTQLSGLPIENRKYLLRASKRQYTKEPITKDQLLKLLTVASNSNGWKSLAHENAVDLYLYVKESGVEGVLEGIYRYDSDHNYLELITRPLTTRIKSSHMPFNRIQYEKSAFSIYLIGNLNRLQHEYGEEGEYISLLQAGYLGQVLMDRQSECEIGLCPIGGINFGKISDDFKLQKGQIVIHSYTGGSYNYREQNLELDEEDIAIIGMSGRFANCSNLEDYWKCLRNGDTCFTKMSDKRKQLYGNASESVCDTVGAYLDDIDAFDCGLFHISPEEASCIDPQERIFLEVVWECLEDAGYTSDRLNGSAGKVGVFAGAMWNDYQNYSGVKYGDQEILATALASSIANRVSYYFNFLGPSIAINTSCSSGMTAIHLACESLLHDDCKTAIAGGINIISHPYHLHTLKHLHFLSDSDRCIPFSAKADGWLAGEGAGAIVLKRMKDAKSDKDQILGIIKATAIGHTGKTARFGAPNSMAQAAGIEAVINKAAIQKDTIAYIEAAAPGASLADSSEMEAIRKVFCERVERKDKLVISSVKGNIGHLESASAISQVIKVLLEFQHHEVAPTVSMHPVNPLIDTKWGAELAGQLIPFHFNHKKRVLINAFGATGSSGHMILENYERPEKQKQKEEHAAIRISAATGEQLREYIRRMEVHLEQHETVLSDLESTLLYGRAMMKERVVFLAASVEQLKQYFRDYLEYAGQAADNDFIVTKESTDTGKRSQIWKEAYQWTCQKDNHFTDTDNPYDKISLPTYPFEKYHRWIPLERELDSQKLLYMQGEKEIQTEQKADQKERVVRWLMAIFAEISGFGSSFINHSKPLEDYGLTSAMIQLLNTKLAQQIGNVSKTIFFECGTIDEVAEYLLEHYSSQLSSLAGSEVKWHKKEKSMNEEIPYPETELDMAVIGLAGIYPKADNVDEFWDNLINGRDCITTIPKERWDYESYFDAEKHIPGKTYCKWGGFINDVDKFDASFFHISPREAAIMDPQERLFLQTAWHALEDSGYNQLELRKNVGSRVGVFVGVMYGEYQLIGAENDQPIFASYSSIANRVSYVLNLSGPSMAVDTMCSSSLTALHLAVESIKRGECKMAIVGGVNLSLHPNKYIAHAQMTMSSDDGHCKSFGKGGNGFVPGEGIGALIIKPLDQASKDHDHIYGVVKGTAINHGGRTNGYTVPSPAAQSNVILNAWRKAGIEPEQISYVEAHGTGTMLGDPIEIEGLTKSFSRDLKEEDKCPVGSVKSNIGHLESAAGVAGITKILLQMKYGQLVPSLFAKEINPNIDLENSPLYIQTSLENWPRKEEGMPRTAVMSAFGACGSNAHAVISEYIDKRPKDIAEEGSNHIIVLSAKNMARLKEYAGKLKEKVDQGIYTDGFLEDIAYTLQVGREPMESRMGTIVSSVSMLSKRLKDFIEDRDNAEIFIGDEEKKKAPLDEMMCSPELKELLNQWARQNNLKKLLLYWVQGAEVEWSILYEKRRPSRVSIVGYPFSKKHYWIEERIKKMVQKSKNVNSYVEEWINGDCMTSKDYQFRHVLCWIGNLEDRQKVKDNLKLKFENVTVTFLDTIDESSIEQYMNENTDIDALLFECENQRSNQWSYADLLTTMRTVIRYSDRLKRAVVFGRYGDRLQRCYMESLIGMQRTFQALKNKDVLSLVIGDSSGSVSAWVAKVIDELGADGNDVARYENEERFVLKLHSCNLEQKAAPKLYDGGTYLITGGLGGIGMKIAGYLVKKYHANLILLGRKTLQTQMADVLSEWNQCGGKVLYVQADVSKKDELQHALDCAKTQFRKIDGVLHLAGTMGNDDLFHKTEEKFRAEIAPKVEGTIWLDQLLEEENLAFMCYFSSSSAILGDFGSYDYAMSNRFLMAYTDYRNQRVRDQQCFGQTYVINWPVWEAGGMTTHSNQLDGYLAATGQKALSAEEGIALLSHVLSDGQPQILFGTADEETANLNNRKPHLEARPDRKMDLFVNHKLKEAVGNILKLSANDVDEQANFSDLGFDSISLSELSKELKRLLGITIAVSLLWKYFTVVRLQDYILSTYHEQIGGGLRCDNKYGSTGQTEEAERGSEVSAKKCEDDNIREVEPIAVIGMSGRFPDADNIEQFWEMLKSGRPAVKEIPKERWDYRENEEISCRWGGFINDVDKFDPLFFNMSPQEAELLDPQQRIFLQESWHALEDAGYMNESFIGSSCGVYVGVEESQYDKLSGNPGGLSSNRNCTLSARIAYELDLKGPNMVINTACSSGLAALSQATSALRNGECEMAIVGGVNLNLVPEIYLGLSKNHLLSTDGNSHVFDQSACGMVPSEAVVSIIIKPLSKARKDRDRIYGCIIGNGMNYNGKSNGLTAPNAEGQVLLMKQVLKKFQIHPSSIDYVMAHSVGSQFGDPLEIDSLQTVMGKENTCFVGSVKPMTGHTFAASGLVNLVAALKAMQEHIMIGVSQLEVVNDEICLEKGGVIIQNQNREWTEKENKKRAASILATGMSGTNANVVIEEYEQVFVSGKESSQEPYLIILSAKTKDALLQSVKLLHDFLMDRKELLLRDISYSLIRGRMPMKVRACFIADCKELLIQLLFDYMNGAYAGRIDIMEGEIRTTESAGEECLLISPEMIKGDLYQCGQKWVRGADIELEGKLEFNYLSLPTYPFEKRVCWYEKKDADLKLQMKLYENEAAKFYTYGTLEKSDDFSLEYLTFCPFEKKIPGFSMSRVFLYPHRYQEEYTLIQQKQIEMREVLFSGVDFAGVKQLFDFGCGHGTDVIQFAEQYTHMTTCGYTITEAQAELGNERIRKKGLKGRVQIYHRDSVKCEFPSGCDVILGIEVACHIKDKRKLFQHASNVLNQNGAILLMDFISNLRGRIEDKGIEVSIATKEDWIEVLSMNGLIVERLIDVSKEIANFLYDPDYEENTKDMPEVVIKGITNFAHNSIALENNWTSYCLFQIRKDRNSNMEERVRLNREAFETKIPYQIAIDNMRKEKLYK